jgi:hypothetical protein
MAELGLGLGERAEKDGGKRRRKKTAEKDGGERMPE